MARSFKTDGDRRTLDNCDIGPNEISPFGDPIRHIPFKPRKTDPEAWRGPGESASG
jgi:hypothetical protein